MSRPSTPPAATDRRHALRRVGTIVLAANLLLVVLKGAVYLSTGSLAVGSETVNSLADVGYGIAVLAGLYVTTRPADRSHPHGHERVEPFVSLAVALGMLVAAAGVLYGAVTTLLAPAPVAMGGPIAVGVLAVGAVAKYGLYRYCLRVARIHDSPALRATALDNRADVLTAGAALAGVVGALAGVPILDPLAAAVVAVGIAIAGGQIVRANLRYLLGGAPEADLQAAIVERALAHPDVRGVHDVVAHHVGPEVDVSLHVEVDDVHSLARAHEIETAIVDAIGDLDRVDDVFVHVDPRGEDEWKSEERQRPTA